jgi:hypothetical protein
MTPNKLFQKLKEFQEVVSLGDYDLTAPFPHEADKLVDGIETLVNGMAAPDIASLREIVDRDLAEKLLAYSRRAAVRALREKSEQRLLDGMVASAIDQDLLDIRDVFRAWVLHYDACKRTNFTFEVLFDRATRHSTESRKRQLANQFLRGPAYTKSIKTMKFALLEDEAEPIYIDQLFSWP